MPVQSALDDQMREGIARVRRADLLVGIPSFRNAGTIGHVASTAAKGLREHFGDSRVVLVNADGGSEDGTRERVIESAGDLPVISGRYVGPPGKGSAFRAIFETAVALDVRACAVVDSDLRSITPMWIGRLIGPVVRAEADYVTPLYARHKHDGTITNSIAYPLTRALYGLRIRQPIGGEFGFHSDLARAFLAQDVWDTDVARFGIDIFMTTTALSRHARVAQAFLGSKIHDPKDPAADLGPMFTEVVGTLFRMAHENEAVWREIHGSKATPVVGDVEVVDPEAIDVDPARLRAKYESLAGAQRALWNDILSAPLPSVMGPDAWARVVFDFLTAALKRPGESQALARALLPLYYLRVAEFVDEAKNMTTEQAEDIVDLGARAMEREKEERASLAERTKA
ncbi:MAG TPA: cell wall biosynthesis glycosyltransferase [Candidatus Limnocylindrales bacterium]|nr:cell wall biosynthesis glycosyltransferase [Candidatus Limnocylindrales bacterium]